MPPVRAPLGERPRTPVSGDASPRKAAHPGNFTFQAPGMTNPSRPCLIAMSKSLVGRRGTNRVILWGRVCVRSLDGVLVAFVLFLIATCVMGAASETPFFETWWGRHLFILSLGFLGLGVLVAAVLPLLRWLRRPLEGLPDLEVLASEAGSEDPSGRRISRRGVMVVAVVVGVPVLVGLFYLEEDWRGERAWNQYERQQEARGERLDAAALIPPPVPDDQNFASTPFLAPLFDYVPGTQQTREADATDGGKVLSLRYDAASSRLEPRKLARSNSWVVTELDLRAWYVAFLEETNASQSSAVQAFRARYGFPRGRTGAAAAPASSVSAEPISSQKQTEEPTLAEAASGVLAALADSEPVLEELRAASRRPYSRFNLHYDLDNPAMILLPHYSVLKRVLQILQLRTSAELALGHTDQAADDVRFMFRLADAIRNEPLLIGHLVRLAEVNIALQPLAEGLARHQWSEPQLRALEEQLRGFNFLADARQAMQGERIVFGSGVIDYTRRSSNRYKALMGNGIGGGNAPASEFNWQSMLLAAVPSGWFYFEKLNYSRAFQDYLLPTIDVPGRRISLDACRRADAYCESLSTTPWRAGTLRHQYFCALLLPALSRVVQKTALAQSGVDCAAVACALERYRLVHGQFPSSLGALVPEFMSQLPHDVISGQPLNYRLAPDGQYVLYSVGWNQTDDGGVLGFRQHGSGIDQSVGDWVWRLPPGPAPNLSAR
jgi:hypothetical protein